MSQFVNHTIGGSQRSPAHIIYIYYWFWPIAGSTGCLRCQVNKTQHSYIYFQVNTSASNNYYITNYLFIRCIVVVARFCVDMDTISTHLQFNKYSHTYFIHISTSVGTKFCNYNINITYAASCEGTTLLTLVSTLLVFGFSITSFTIPLV